MVLTKKYLRATVVMDKKLFNLVFQLLTNKETLNVTDLFCSKVHTQEVVEHVRSFGGSTRHYS